MNGNPDYKLDQLIELDAICKRFETQWNAGNEPCIADFLAAASSLPRDMVLRELLVTDIEQRSRNKCVLSVGDYTTCFSNETAVVDEAIKEAASMGHWIPGVTMGRYEILTPIGAGGMGRVFCAQDSRLDRQVAIKALPAEFCKNKDWIAQCKKETSLLSKMAHANVVVIHDIEQFEGQVFFVMELLKGKNLRQLLSNNAIHSDNVDDIVRQAIDGLSAIHQAGIVHCDIKPSNIFLTEDGVVKLLDFGVASFEKQVKTGDRAIQSKHSSAGGTQPYMSPEQTRNAALDARSDIFSFGSVIFELLTREKAFHRETRADTLAAVLKDNPLENCPLDMPAKYRRLLTTCLQKDPAKRYANVGQLKAEFNSPPRQTENWLSASSRWFATAAIGTVLISGLTWSIYQTSPTNEPPPVSSRGLGSIDSLAILPFDGTEETELLSDGLTFSLIDELSGTDQLQVRPYSAVQRISKFDGNTQSPEISNLKVAAVVTGHLRQDDDEVLVHVEIIDTSKNSVVWAKNYRRKKSQYMEIQNTIVTDLRHECLLKNQSSMLNTKDLAAFEYYVQGLVAWNRRDPASLETAISCFKKAVELDPEYCLAYAGLSKCYIVQAERNLIPSEKGFEMARQNALMALEKNKHCLNAKIVLAMIAFEYDWNFEGAEKQFREGLFYRDNPIDHPTGHQWYAEFLSAMGRHDEAKQIIEFAKSQNPTSAIICTIKGLIQLKANNLDLAAKYLDEVLLRYPNFNRARGYLIDAYELQGDFDRAIEQWRALANANQSPVDKLSEEYKRLGPSGYWKARIEQSEDLSEIRPIAKIFAAIPFCQLAQFKNAFAILETGVENRNGAIAPTLLVHPGFDSIRSEKKFQQLLDQVGFPKPD